MNQKIEEQKTADKKNMKQNTAKTVKQMICFTILLLLITVLFLHLYHEYQQSWMKSVYITFLTIFYHFAMRLIVGETITILYKKREFNIDSPGFRIHSFEPKLYEVLRVKQWKTKVITAKPEQFDLRTTGTEALLHNMLQAEMVHRIIIVLSFVPLLFIIPYGKPVVFLLTSICASGIDLIFVMIQRYNRPRIMRLIRHGRKDREKRIDWSIENE